MKRRVLAAAIMGLFCLAPKLALADCTGPDGVAGQLTWISPNLQYCDGSSWLMIRHLNTNGYDFIGPYGTGRCKSDGESGSDPAGYCDNLRRALVQAGGDILNINYNNDYDGGTMIGAAASPVMFLPNGNVGIGTTTPTQLLQVGGGTAPAVGEIRGNGSGYGAGFRIWNTAVAAGANSYLDFGWGTAFAVASIHARPQSDNSSDLAFQGSDTSRNRSDMFYIDGSSGKVGIGTSVPAHELHIKGAASGEGTPGLFIQDPTTNDTYGGRFYYDDSGGLEGFKVATMANSVERSFIYLTRDSSSIGVNTSAPSATLDVNGYAKLKNNTAAPVACAATYKGSVALTSATRMCLCDGTSWKEVNSATTCAW